MKVLITNSRLAEQTGSERLVRDLALLLQAGGITPAVYVSEPGPLAKILQDGGIPVVDHPLAGSFQPDLIHGYGNLETIVALLAHPGVPAVFSSAGTGLWQQQAPLHPRICRYLASNPAGRARLTQARGIAPERIAVLPEAMDFSALGPPRQVPVKPRTALFADPGLGREEHLARKACQELDIQFDSLSNLSGKSSLRPGDLFPLVDLVFAQDGLLLEALASGCGAIPVSQGYIGELVTVRNFPAASAPVGGERPTGPSESIQLAELVAEIDNWDWSAIAPLAHKVRERHGPEAVHQRLRKIYHGAIAENEARLDRNADESAWTANWLLEFARQQGRLDSGHLELRQRAASLREERNAWDAQSRDLQSQLAVEKEKVRFARRLLQDGTVLNAGLRRRMEEGWLEIEARPAALRAGSGTAESEPPTHLIS